MSNHHFLARFTNTHITSPIDTFVVQQSSPVRASIGGVETTVIYMYKTIYSFKSWTVCRVCIATRPATRVLKDTR